MNLLKNIIEYFELNKMIELPDDTSFAVIVIPLIIFWLMFILFLLYKIYLWGLI